MAASPRAGDFSVEGLGVLANEEYGEGRWFRHRHGSEVCEIVTRLLLGYRHGVTYDLIDAKDRKKDRPNAESYAELILSKVPPLPNPGPVPIEGSARV